MVQIFFLLFFATLPFQFALSPFSGVDLHISRLFSLAIALFWITDSLLKRSVIFPLRRETALVSSFLFFSAFSIFFAEYPAWGFRKLAFLLSFFPLFFVAFSVFQTEKFRNVFLRWFVYGSAFSAIVGIFQFFLPWFIGLDPSILLWQKHIISFFSGHEFSSVVSEYSSMVVNVGGTNFLRASAFFPDPHVASFFWGMTIPLSIGFFFSSRGFEKRWFFLIFAILLFADLLTFSRGGYLALFSALFIFFLFFFSSVIRKHIPVFFFFVLCFLCFFLIPNPLSGRIFSIFDTFDHSNTGRIVIWQEAIGIIEENPLTGVGLGNYSNTVKPSADYREPRYAHNIFLDISAESGIVNAFLFFLLLLSVLIRSFKWRHEPLFVACGFSMIIFSIHSLFETSLYSVHILPLFLTLIAFLI